MIERDEEENFSGDSLTTNQGLKITDNENSLKTGDRGATLLEDFVLREKIMHFDHERMPERVVHARGAGAHGVFKPYKSLSNYTKAKFLSSPDIETPVFVRFSTVAGSRGSADTVRDVRGFAVKFYTEEGNYDLVGNNMPVFFIQDAIKFPDLVHAVKPEPHNEIPQGASAHDSFWDFASLVPETTHMLLWVMSDRALPKSYAHMQGFGVHTFRLINEDNKTIFVKFHWTPVKGAYSLVWDEAQKIAGKDPDFHRRNLWESIEKGNFPEYELGIQIIQEDQEFDFDFDLLDPTKIWPEELIPVETIGKMTLNRNPDNYFAETEQVMFNPGHLVPGIGLTNDPLLQGRLFSYLDTQINRFGTANFSQLPINSPNPKARPVNHFQDGFMQNKVNKNRVNYYPNSLGGGLPEVSSEKEGGFATYPESTNGTKVRNKSESFKDFFSQASLFFNSMSEHEKQHIIKAFSFELAKVEKKEIRVRMVENLKQVDLELANTIAKKLGLTDDKTPAGDFKASSDASPKLSLESLGSDDTYQGRKIAVILSETFDEPLFDSLKTFLDANKISFETISDAQKKIKSVEIEKSLHIVDSVMYDAIFVISDDVENKDKVDEMVKEAYQHCKPVYLSDASKDSFKALKIKADDKDGVFNISGKDNLEKIKESLVKHRYFDRENKLKLG